MFRSLLCRRFRSRCRNLLFITVTILIVIICVQELAKYMNPQGNQKPKMNLRKTDSKQIKLKEERKLSKFFKEYNKKMDKVTGTKVLKDGKTTTTTTTKPQSSFQSGEEIPGKLIVWYLIQDDLELDEEMSCGPYQCTFLTDTSRMAEADAIIVDGLLLSQKQDPITPVRSGTDQVWIYYSQDPWSAYSSDFPYGKWNSIFNWTFTYHRDSEFIIPGPELVKKLISYQVLWDETMEMKKKQVLWISNECTTTSRLEDYVTELKKYINVDIMGDCGNTECSDENTKTSCYDDYMFSLSFESTHCKDYITKAFFDTFYHPIINIVRGGANYSKRYPKDLYINTADFASPRLLADYLYYLMKNTTAYVEYLQRRANYIVMDRGNSQCLICASLHNLNTHRKFYPDIASYMGTCTQPTDLNF